MFVGDAVILSIVEGDMKINMKVFLQDFMKRRIIYRSIVNDGWGIVNTDFF